MSTSKTLIFFGNERLSTGYQPDGVPTLQALIDAGYHIAAVVANQDSTTSRKARQLEVQTVAHRHNIPVFLPKKLADISDKLAAFKPDAGVLVAYGRIIPQSIIAIFPYGILNIHPSLLPTYRGSTPIEQALLDGASTTGVSIMQLVREMDAGPIFAQQSIELSGTETKQQLTGQLHMLGTKLILATLPQVFTHKASPTAQNESAATYTKLINKSDGMLDLAKPAIQLERQIRAYAVWPKSRTTLSGHDVIITKAKLTSSPELGAIVLACNPGWLEVIELVAPSGKSMSSGAFMRGYGS